MVMMIGIGSTKGENGIMWKMYKVKNPPRLTIMD
jgi:hypothetical protein